MAEKSSPSSPSSPHFHSTGGAWQDRGVCRRMDPSPWQDPPRDARDVVEACLACPVLAECREYASAHRWAVVVVGGWRAPVTSAYPPWRR